MAKRIVKAITAPSPQPSSELAKWLVEFTPSNTKRGGYSFSVEQDIGSLDFDRLLNGFWEAFGVPRAVITSEFREYAKKFLKSRGKLRKSALRWLMEGRIAGVPQPVHKYRYPKRLHEVLLIADLAETMVFDFMGKIYGEEKELDVLVSVLEDSDGRDPATAVEGTPDSGGTPVLSDSLPEVHGETEPAVPSTPKATRRSVDKDA